ncbi:MAG: alginate O-acetyltransferase complex protein AlgI [Limisphaerales bacterium]|jgi:alginate O-acetyltransferase complex protein AlgI
MLFNSITFVLFHLSLVALYWAAEKQVQRLVYLLVGSVVFYGWYYWPAVFLLGGSMIVNFVLSHKIEKTRSKKILTLGVVLNLGNLLWFKYSAFLAANIVGLLNGLGVHVEAPKMSAWLPLGISFYTFQIIGYLVNVARGEVEAERSFLRFGVFKCFYGQLIAGPIVRARELLPQLQSKREFSQSDFHLGIYYMIAGLAIKVFVADTLSQFADYGFANPSELGQVTAWATLYAFAFQILADFWGYSTIAMGVGLMFGIRLPLNFNLPYFADSIREFWRRWHITLSEWLRDFIYIPLGGNRRTQMRNLMLTMLLGGLWHGASWNFVIWGGGHGLWLVLERVCPFSWPNKPIFRWVKTALIFHGVCLLWVFFRAQNFGGALAYFHALFLPSPVFSASPPDALVFVLLSFVLFMATLGKSLTDRRFLKWSLIKQVSVTTLLIVLILCYADARLDFIYFVF